MNAKYYNHYLIYLKGKKKILNMSYMLAFCRTLESLPDISRWNFYNIKNIYYIFFNCISLKSLPDITMWNISDDCRNNNIFKNCVSVNISQKFINKFK